MAIPHAIGASSKAIATSSLCRGPHRPRQGQRRDGGASVWTSLDYALWALGRVSGFQWLMAGVRMALHAGANIRGVLLYPPAG